MTKKEKRQWLSENYELVLEAIKETNPSELFYYTKDDKEQIWYWLSKKFGKEIAEYVVPIMIGRATGH